MPNLILNKLERNKIMKDSLSSQNSFIFDRNWEKVNPKNEPTVSVEQAKLFLKLVVEDYERLKNSQEVMEGEARVMDKIELFLFKYIQEKELAVSAKRELPTLQKTPYRLTLNDCLEIWRWLSEDSTSYRTRQVAFDQSMNVNEFQLGTSLEGGVEIKKSVDYSSKNKKSFRELSLQEQEMVLKKSLEMVHLYFHQFKIIFNHYCRFPIENQHKRTTTFDDVSHSLQTLTINRFMLFCREFDILKTLEFKRRTEHNPSMSKEFLMKTFKKNAHHQKFMNLDSFLMTLVHISIKIHENFDPRSNMHTEIFLNSLKVKYYEQFVGKLDSLHIKYSPTDFYNCYRHIFDKQSIKKKKESKKQAFQNNSYLTGQDYVHRGLNDELGNIRLNQSVAFLQKQPVESRIYRSHHSVPNLLMGNYGESKKKTLQRRKVSVPALPSLQENRFFKPIEHNHHLNSYNKYLQKVEETSSVFKNRITGYSNINALKTKGFHTNPNPEAVSKETLDSLLAKKKIDSQFSSYNNRFESEIPQDNLSFGGGQLNNESNYRSQNTVMARRAENKDISTEQSASQQMTSSKLSALTSKGLLRMQQKKQALQSLKQKIDVREDDQLLKKHLVAEENRQKEIATASNMVHN